MQHIRVRIDGQLKTKIINRKDQKVITDRISSLFIKKDGVEGLLKQFEKLMQGDLGYVEQEYDVKHEIDKNHK
jgi:hypothetical protein